MSYVISFGWVSCSYSSSYSSPEAVTPHRDVLNVLVVLVGTTISASEITTLTINQEQETNLGESNKDEHMQMAPPNTTANRSLPKQFGATHSQLFSQKTNVYSTNRK